MTEEDIIWITALRLMLERPHCRLNCGDKSSNEKFHGLENFVNSVNKKYSLYIFL